MLDHISMIISTEKTVDFYKDLGFEETKRIKRSNDEVIFMSGAGTKLEMYLDEHHETKDNAETYGIRHISFKVDDIDCYAEKYGIKEIKSGWNKEHYFYVQDPDGFTLEFHD